MPFLPPNQERQSTEGTYISKDMLAVKLCTNKILQFLTGGAGWRRLTCIMAIEQW